MLSWYLDDSDATISKVETIAGYVANEDGWHRFESLANDICDRYEVKLVRGREIDGRSGDFKGWNLPKTERFLEEIGSAMRENVLFGISRSIGKEHYKLRKRQLKLKPNMSGFCFCFATIVASMREPAHGLVDQVNHEGVTYMLEAGSLNNPDIMRYINDEIEHGNINANTKAIEVEKMSCRAVQIADLYAFYSRRKANKFSRFGTKVAFFPDIHTLHIAPKVDHYSGYIEEPYREMTNVKTGEHIGFATNYVTPF